MNIPIVFLVSFLMVNHLHYANAQCHMAYCTPSLSGIQNQVAAPRDSVNLLWHRKDIGKGSLDGLGCSSNGVSSVCTLAGTHAGITALDINGQTLWQSSDISGINGSYQAAPFVFGFGDNIGAVAHDTIQITMFNSSGGTLWNNIGETKFNPILTQNQKLVLGSHLGGIVAYTNYGLAFAAIRFTLNGKIHNVTHTTAVYRNRIYVPTAGALFAVDSRTSSTLRLNISWNFPFEGAPSCHPLFVYNIQENREFVVILNGSIVIIEDLMWSTNVISVTPMGPKGPNYGLFGDNRGGFWVFSREDCIMMRYSELNGTVLQTIDWTKTFPQCQITSEVTLVGYGQNSTMLFGMAVKSSNILLAMDVNTEEILWTFEVDGEMRGQLPVMNSGNSKAVIVPTVNNGVFAIGSL